MSQEKIDYSKINKEDLILWFGKKKTELLLQFSGLKVKTYNDLVDEINYYYKDNIPYIQHNIKTNEISINFDVIKYYDDDELYCSVFQLLTDISDSKHIEQFKLGKFEIIDVINKFKTFEDCCNSIDINIELFNSKCILAELTSDEIAYKQIKLITQALNDTWTPDWDNSSQGKYFPWFDIRSSGSGFAYHVFHNQGTHAYVASRLCFKSRYLAEYAGKQFVSIYKDYMVTQ